VLLRVLCVAVITHVAANVCRDCGEATLAGYAELGGKIEILLLSLPLIEGIVGTVIELAG
jgi:stage III sporulation protein AD